MKLYMFRTVRLSILRSLFTVQYTQQCYMTYRFVDNFRAGPEWNCSSILVLPDSCLQTCMTYTIAEYTMNKLLMMDRRTVRNM